MGNLHGVKVYDNIMVGLLFCCLLVVIGVVNVSMASVGVVVGLGRIVWGWVGKDGRMEGARGRKQGGVGGQAWVSFFLILYCKWAR